MSGTAAGDDADPPAGSRICAHDRPAVCIGSAQLVGVDSMDQSIQLLESGRADVTLNSETAFGDYLKKHPDAPVKIAARSETTTSSVIPVRKGSTALLEAIDEALDALRDSGELSALSQRYFGMDVTQE